MSKLALKVPKASWLLRVFVALIASAGTILGLAPTPSALAIGSAITGSATLASGQGRAIAAAWSGVAPFNVSFQCNVPGCTSYFSGSTTLTSVGGYAQLATCSSVTKSHYISVVDSLRDSANANSTTTWNKVNGAACA